MPKKFFIFISYRRKDSEDIVGRIYDRLKDNFGDIIFLDIDTIPYGEDFQIYIDKVVSQCQVILAVIGSQWLSLEDEFGNSRIEQEEDFVRLEIETALNRNIPLIPVLVSGASMPSKDELPSSIQKIAYRNGIRVRSGRDFHKDIDDLIKTIEKQIPIYYSSTYLRGIETKPNIHRRNLLKIIGFICTGMGLAFFGEIIFSVFQ